MYLFQSKKNISDGNGVEVPEVDEFGSLERGTTRGKVILPVTREAYPVP